MFAEIFGALPRYSAAIPESEIKRMEDKSPRMGEDFSLGKDKTLREFILILLEVQD